MNARLFFVRIFQSVALAAVLLLPVGAGAVDITLDPGYIEGSVNTGSGSVVSISVSASGGGYTSSRSVSNTKDYSLTVQGGTWNYTVNASAQVRQGQSSYPYTNLNFGSRSFPVQVGQTVTNDYNATGAVRFHVSITGDPYTSWNAYGYASKAASGGNEQTNSNSYTYSSYSPDKTWVMPVVPNSQIRIYSYVYVDNSIYYFWTDVASYLYKDIAAGETVDVYMNVVHKIPDPPLCQVHPEQCPPTVYDYGSVQGTVNLDIGDPSQFYRHYHNGFGYISANPGGYKINSVITGNRSYQVSTYFDSNKTSYQWPSSTGVKSVAVLKGQTSYLDFSDSTGILTGKFKLTGTLQNNTVNSYTLTSSGSSRIYTAGQGWVNQPTSGGSSSISRTSTDGRDSYQYFLSGGYWNPYYFSMNKYDYTSGYYHRQSLSLYDYNHYYDGSSYNYGQPAIITPGSTTVQDRELCFGSVVIRFRDYSGGTMSNPQVSGSGAHYNANNKQDLSISVSANHNIPNAAAPEVEVHGPPATYSLTSRATAQDGTSISFPAIGIGLECGVRKCSDRKAPSITMSSPSPELITNAQSVTVSGTTTDEYGIQSVLVNDNAAQWWHTGNPGAPNEVAFTYDLAVVPGRNHIRTFIENTECNSCFDERNVYVDRWMPVVAIATPHDGDIYTPNGPTVPVTVNAADQGYGYTLTVYLDGTKIGQVTGPANDAAQASSVFNGSIGPLSTGSHVIKAVAVDLAGNRAETTTTIVSNRAPTADAGPDQIVECASPNGTPLTLNGSGSSDPENDALTYTWTWSGGSATGAGPTVTLPYGATAVTLTVADGKGGTAQDTVTITVSDTTPPVTTLRNVSGFAGDNGWYRSDVTITVDSTDACSGVKDIRGVIDGTATTVAGSAAMFTISGDGVHTATYRAKDNAGNIEGEQAGTIMIDMTLPAVTASVSPAAGANGWHNGEVLVTFTCSDALSGIASCPAPVTVTVEGANQVITGTARDNAGNSASTSVNLNIDKTAPVITAVAAPASNANGWNNGDVTVTFTCSDALSGVASCPAPVTVTAEGANQVISGTTTDKAGNTATASVTLNIDKTRPTITATAAPAANANGWNNGDVTVTFTCGDTLSGVASCPAPVIVTSEGAGQVVTGTVVDKAGNSATTSATVNLDKTPPVITATVSPSANGNGWYSTDVTVTFTCSDALSGVASCPSPITVTAEGAGQVITGAAVDKAGNTATASVTVNIDKTAPTAAISVTPGILWPPNHKMVNVTVNGGVADPTSSVASVVITVKDEYGTVQPVVNGFNTTIPLEAWREGDDMDGRHYLITAVITDKAGNKTTVSTEAVCPHDMRDKK